MMGHQSRQIAMLFVDIESLIPETHLLRKIERMVSGCLLYRVLSSFEYSKGFSSKKRALRHSTVQAT